MKKILFTILVLFISGCAGSIQKSLEGCSGELMYLHDSTKIPEKEAQTLKIGSFIVDDVLTPSVTVTKTGTFILPLIVFNMWKYDFQSSLGYTQIRNDYKQFIKDSFIEEFRRSCKFKHVEENSSAEINIKFKNVTMSAPIRKSGYFAYFFYGASYAYGTWTGPVHVIVTANAVLKKDGQELLNKEFQGTYQTIFLQDKNTKIEDYTTAMIEGLSLAIKDLNERIVKGINEI
jgi:uncharacterized lipoprotein YmbA